MRVLCVLLLVSSLAAAAEEPERFFNGPRLLPAPNEDDLQLRVEDVNGDGRNDLVYVGWNRYIYLFVARADGYEPAVRRVAPPLLTAGLTSPVVADFDRDGLPDAVSRGYTDDLELRRGLPGGGLGEAVPIAGSSILPWARDQVTGDFDADGWPDLAVSNGSTLAIFWNERTGTFRRQEQTIAAHRLEAGDMNGDGRDDLLAVTRTAPTDGTATDGTVTKAWLSDGRRFHRSPYLFDPGDRHHTLGDLDGNGTADVIAASGTPDYVAGVILRDGAISVVLSGGDGPFGETQHYFTGTAISSLLVADVDNDGKQDVTFGGYLKDERLDEPVWWVRGNGDGTLDASPAVDLCRIVSCLRKDWWPRKEVVADVTGDGIPDYVVYTPERLTVLAGSANLTGRRIAVTPVPPSGHVQPLGDVNGDGRDDLLLLADDSPGWADLRLMVFHGREDGSFGEAQRWVADASVSTREPIGADFTGDGVVDLLRPNGELYAGDGGGRFAASLPLPEVAAHTRRKYAAADIDGDGRIDLAAVKPGRATDSGWSFWLNRGHGKFDHRAVPLGEWNAADFLLADFTGDGIADRVDLDEVHTWVICCLQVFDGHRATMWRGVGDGTFTPIAMSIRLPDGWLGMAALDFNSDGHTDLAIGTEIYLGEGDGTIRSGALFPADLAAISHGTVVARRGHVYAPLVTREVSARTPVSVDIVPLSDAVYADVTSTTNIPPRGTVLFELDGGRKIEPLSWRRHRAWLELSEPPSTTIRATYSGDEKFAPATAAAEYVASEYDATIRIDARTRDGRPTTTFVAGEPIRLHVSVERWRGYGTPPTGGRITVTHQETLQLLGSAQGVLAEFVLDTELLGTGQHTIWVEWAGGANAEFVTFTFTVLEPPTERRRSVR